ncbi:MamL-1 domain protein [Dictyocaulus viviparus]|uniref:MamL-1 domain protein n=1 Tax=Dictyocaulus viviparus TaxID=29172 RepID=A0A0D8Y3N8_DICVI|nr:MamL-1 domain protein [Dictyocaulus viviparus]
MPMAAIHGQSPTSTVSGDTSTSTTDPPTASFSDGDRLRASMEAWKRSAALASERYGEARQRQIAAERDDRYELRKRWLEEEAKKRAESLGKQKEVANNCNVSTNMPPPLYQSTPVNNRDRKRHFDSNDYGHEEWRQEFRMMEIIFKMPGMQQQSCKNMMTGFPTGSFQSSGSYTVDPYPSNNGMASSIGQYQLPERASKFCSDAYLNQPVASSTFACSPMPSTSTADLPLRQGYPSADIPQFSNTSDSVATGSLQSHEPKLPVPDAAIHCCDGRPSTSTCPTSPNEIPTPPALAHSGSATTGNSCASMTTMVEHNLRSPAEDLGFNAVNEDNMTRMLTSIPTDSLGMLGADAVDSIFDGDTTGDSAAGQVPVVTSTDSNSPTNFNHGGPQSVHSTDSAPQSSGNGNPPSTPTVDATSTSLHPAPFSQVSTSQLPTFFQQSPSQSSTFPQQSPSQQSIAYPPSASGQPPPFQHDPHSKNPFFIQASSSRTQNYSPATMGPTTSFSCSQPTGFATVSQQPPGFSQHNTLYPNSFPHSGTVFNHSEPLNSKSNFYPASSANPVGSPFVGQQSTVNAGFNMNGYPIYGMPTAQMSQRQVIMQAHHQQQMAMAMSMEGSGGAMNPQQYNMIMMQKHQQNTNAMMQQRAAMMYHGYPNGATMSQQQQYVAHMNKMQQQRFYNGVSPSEPAFMSCQRNTGMNESSIGVGFGTTVQAMTAPSSYPLYSQTFAAQQ